MNFDIIARPLGMLLTYIYNTIGFHNYGLAIVFFTVLVKLLLLPLTVKQYRSSARMQEVQPMIQEIQKRYKNDKEKLNQELMKVYSEHNVNPAGGCLPLLVQMPILLSLYWVVIQPLKFMLGKNPEQVQKLVEIAKNTGADISQSVLTQQELIALNHFNENRELLNQTAGLLNANELINFNFLGLHLGWTPTISTAKLFGEQAYIFLPLLIIPVLAVITTFLSTKLSMAATMKNNTQMTGAAASMTNSMLYIGPLMTLYFSFLLPAGVGLYWIVGYVFQIFQQLYINKHVISKKTPVAVKAAAAEETKAIEEGTSEGTVVENTDNKGNQGNRNNNPSNKQGNKGKKKGGAKK